ncbi:MAG: hypothetical protein R3Y49_08260, partial [Rikenellaceae bacterium]
VDADAEISFGGATSSDNSEYDGTVYINAPADVEFEDLNINLPNAHVVFNGEVVQIGVASGTGTFIVTEGAKIGALTVNAGNVEIYGSVKTISVAEDNGYEGTITVDRATTTPQIGELGIGMYSMVYCISNEAGLLAAIADQEAEIKLTSDFTVTTDCKIAYPVKIYSDETNRATITFTDSGRFNVSADCEVENLILKSATSNYVILTSGAISSLNIKNTQIESKQGIYFASTSTGATLTVEDCEMTSVSGTGTSNYGIYLYDYSNATGLNLELLNSTIEWTNALYVYQAKDSGDNYAETINIIGSTLIGTNYTLKFSYIEETTINIENSTVIGSYNSSNTSERNTMDFTSNNTNYNYLIFKNSVIKTVKDGTASGKAFHPIDMYASVSFDLISFLGDTKIVDECVQGTEEPCIYLLKHSTSVWQENLLIDETVELVGQFGVRLQNNNLWGRGTEKDPYIVAFFDDLSLVNNSVAAHNDMEGYYKQVQDIDCGGSTVTRLFSYDSGKESNYFVGTYDGGGFSIYDYKYSSSFNTSSSYNSLGLIPVLGTGGTVKDVNLVANDTDTYYFAPNRADAQFVGTIVGTCYGSVENCSSNMNIVFGANATTSTAGGIIGCLESTGSYSDITYTGTITYTDGTTSTDPIGVASNEGN